MPNVIGTGLGIKRRQGASTGSAALIVYVDQKVPDRQLDRPERIPASLSADDGKLLTDVVEIAGIRPEVTGAPYFISDGAAKSTMAAFARSEQRLYAVTCAHCVRGSDGNPHTIERIDFWDERLGQYVHGGESAFAITGPGFGLPGNFGFSDAALVLLRHSELLRRARGSPPLETARTIRRGTRVTGHGPKGVIPGEIDAVEAVIRGRRIDVVIFMPSTGTLPGNSGMLWRARDGAAVAVHAFGMYSGNSPESRYSLAMSAERLARELQVDLLDPGGASAD